MLWVEEKSVLEARKAQLPKRLANYKEMHKGTASSKGVIAEFMAAKTLTQCRKILWGSRSKN
jgi:hypothetical protein